MYSISAVILRLLIAMNARDAKEDVMFLKLLLIAFCGIEKIIGDPVEDEATKLIRRKSMILLMKKKILRHSIFPGLFIIRANKNEPRIAKFIELLEEAITEIKSEYN